MLLLFPSFLFAEVWDSNPIGQKVAKKENGVQRLLRRQKRNMRFFGLYAEEVICVPIYRVYQERWRMKMNLKCKHISL